MTHFLPGTSWRLFFYEGNVNNRLMHIRAVVDNDYVVYCHWMKHRKAWSYRIEHISLLEIYKDSGHLTYVGRRYGTQVHPQDD